MAFSLPTVILAHGAWHTPASYRGYIEALKTQGFTIHCPHLPSCSNASPPSASLPEDVACVWDIVKPLVEAGEEVLMVMHSYGGPVGTDAINEDMTFSKHKNTGKPGGVIHLLYLCAFIPPPGATVYGIVQEAKMEQLFGKAVRNYDDASTFPLDPGLLFFSGMADKEIVDKALETLVRHPISALTIPTTGDAWRTVPVTYILTERGYAMARIYQDIMLGKVREEGIVPRIKAYDTHHNIFLTEQEEMVKMALETANDERNSQFNVYICRDYT